MMEETFQPKKIMYENPGVRENTVCLKIREERRKMKPCFRKELHEIGTWRPLVGFCPNV